VRTTVQGREIMSGDKDSEITLGMGKLLGIFFGLVVFCGLSLGIGYRLGWKSAMQEATIHPNAASASSTSAPDSAKETAGAASNGTTAQSSDCSGADCAPAAAEEGGAASELTFYQTVQENKPEPKLTPPATAPKAPEKHRVLGGGYMVQVAAVSREDDAKLLQTALQKQRYPVLITQPGDKLFHVQVGPYADLKDAKEIRQRLLQAGYSAFLKK
jgi:DedD protein